MFRTGFLLFIGLCGYCCLFAQVDTALQLPSIEVSAVRLRMTPPGEQVAYWDSAQLARATYQTAAELLSRESGIFIKNYGPGSSATSSIRGGSAGQTSVIWNGLPLQSPMLGQLDLSLLPMVFADRMQVRYGGNGASWGSGAIGGVITIDNQPTFNIGQAVNLSSALGSFGRWDQQLKWQYGNGKFAGSTRLFYQQAKNDFYYSIRPDLPKRQQQHAAIKQAGVLQELYWKNRPNQEFSLHFWGQEADREIPPLTTQTRSAAEQEDQFFRTALHWKKQGNHYALQARTGLFWERLDYRDELIGLDSRSHFLTLMGDLEGQWQWKTNRKFQLGLSQIFTQATADGYQENPTQYRVSLFAAYQQNWGPWTAQLSARQEVVDGKFVPLIPHLGLEGKVLPWLTIKGKIARNYRLPSLNDLYWRPGGNADLVAEIGWSEELGLTGNWKLGRHQLNYSLTVFNRRIHNWILWSLKTGDSYWSASNIAEVWSRGVEQRLSWHRSFPNGYWRLSTGYDLTWSTNEKTIQNPAIAAGEQLFYVPKDQVFASADLQWKNWNLSYQHQYTGAVSTLNAPLKGYQVGSGQLQYHYKRRHFQGALFLQVDNCWNADYRVVERRPMPGRYFQVGIRVGVMK